MSMSSNLWQQTRKTRIKRRRNPKLLYEIGAYQVCEKWLKDRRGEALSHAEVRQYRAILVAVAETLAVMGKIDSVLW